MVSAMPFKSRAQMRYMFANHPEIARRWVEKYGIPDNLPERKTYAEHLKRTLERYKRR